MAEDIFKNFIQSINMIIRKTRFRRNLFTIFSLIFLSILFMYILIAYQSIDDSSQFEQWEFCNETILRQHFMDNKSPEELFREKPIRTPFTYELTNQNICSSIKPHALIFVVSKSTNFDSRNAIRRTWGNFHSIQSLDKFAHLRLKLLFLIDIDESHLFSIKLEQKLFEDIIQVHLPEHYTLSTYRDMAILHWTNEFCSDAFLTIKTDDDIFLNIYLLANIISTLLTNLTMNTNKNECLASQSSGTIYGIRINHAHVVRDSSDPILESTRYIVTNDEYPCAHYPNYMSGFGYLIDSYARQKLLCSFFRQRHPFYMSDVYVTGILPEYLGIQRKHLGLTISYRSTDDCEKYFKINDADQYACASGLHYKKNQMNIFERFNIYWQRIHEKKLLYIHRRFLYLFKDLS